MFRYKHDQYALTANGRVRFFQDLVNSIDRVNTLNNRLELIYIAYFAENYVEMNFQQLMTEWPLQLCILVNPSQRFQENSFKYFTIVSGDEIQTLTITLTPPITLAWVCDQKSLRLESEGSVEEQLQHTIFLLRAELELTRKPLDFSRKFIRTGQMPKIIKRTAENRIRWVHR